MNTRTVFAPVASAPGTCPPAPAPPVMLMPAAAACALAGVRARATRDSPESRQMILRKAAAVLAEADRLRGRTVVPTRRLYVTYRPRTRGSTPSCGTPA